VRTFARRLSLPQRFYLALFEVLADFDHLLVILDRQCLRPNNNELHVSKSMEPLTSMIFCFSMMATITARILSSVAVVFSRYSWYACSLERKKKNPCQVGLWNAYMHPHLGDDPFQLCPLVVYLYARCTQQIERRLSLLRNGTPTCLSSSV